MWHLQSVTRKEGQHETWIQTLVLNLRHEEFFYFFRSNNFIKIISLVTPAKVHFIYFSFLQCVCVSMCSMCFNSCFWLTARANVKDPNDSNRFHSYKRAEVYSVDQTQRPPGPPGQGGKKVLFVQILTWFKVPSKFVSVTLLLLLFCFFSKSEVMKLQETEEYHAIRSINFVQHG